MSASGAFRAVSVLRDYYGDPPEDAYAMEYHLLAQSATRQTDGRRVTGSP